MVVAAHPDDEILGCGGTIARLAKNNNVFSMVLGEGVTSRDNARDVGSRKSELSTLQKQMQKTNKILGVKELVSYQLPDNRFDEVALLDITKLIESMIERVKPDTIFTHYQHDLNIDHELTFRAALTASRPLPGQSVKAVYAFETISSTEFKFPLSFSPDTFSDITDFLKIKQRALAEYKTEMKPFPHPRSLEMVKKNAEYWGVRVGVPAAEAFQTIRCLW